MHSWKGKTSVYILLSVCMNTYYKCCCQNNTLVKEREKEINTAEIRGMDPSAQRSLCVCVYVWVAQLCLTLCNPMDCSPPGSSVNGILQAKILQWVAIPFSRGSSTPRDRICVSCIGRWILYCWTTSEAHKVFSSVLMTLVNLEAPRNFGSNTFLEKSM